MSDRSEDVERNTPAAGDASVTNNNETMNTTTTTATSRIPRLVNLPRSNDASVPVPETTVAPVPNTTTATNDSTAPQVSSTIRVANAGTMTAESILNSCFENPTFSRSSSGFRRISTLLSDIRSPVSSSSSIQRMSSRCGISRATLARATTMRTATSASASPRSPRIRTKRTCVPNYRMLRAFTIDENHLRVTEKNRLQAFEVLRNKLRELQSTFLKKYLSVKDITSIKVKGPFKFVSLVQNEFCRLVVTEDDLIRLPKNIPSESVNDLKEFAKECFMSNLEMLDSFFADLKLFEIESNWLTVLETIRGKLQFHQNGKMDELMKKLDLLCKVPPTDAEAELSVAMDKLVNLEIQLNKFKSETQKEKAALVAQHELALAREIKNRKDTVAKVLRQSILSSSVQATLSEKDEQIELKNKRINVLLKELEDHKQSIKELKVEKQKANDTKLFLEEHIFDIKEELRLATIEISDLYSRLEESRKLQKPVVPTYNKEEVNALRNQLKHKQKRLESLQEQQKASTDLLKLRSEIINTLEERENELSAKVDTLETENEEQNSLISLISTDFQNKSDDFRLVADTLEKKDDEVFSQSQVIKLLQNNDERNHKLRIFQQEKIAELTAEVARLRSNFRKPINKVNLQ